MKHSLPGGHVHAVDRRSFRPRPGRPSRRPPPGQRLQLRERDLVGRAEPGRFGLAPRDVGRVPPGRAPRTGALPPRRLRLPGVPTGPGGTRTAARLRSSRLFRHVRRDLHVERSSIVCIWPAQRQHTQAALTLRLPAAPDASCRSPPKRRPEGWRPPPARTPPARSLRAAPGCRGRDPEATRRGDVSSTVAATAAAASRVFSSSTSRPTSFRPASTIARESAGRLLPARQDSRWLAERGRRGTHDRAAGR